MQSLHIIRYLSGSLLLVWILTSSMCQTNQTDYLSPPKSKPAVKTADQTLALEIRYEVETVSYQRTKAPDDKAVHAMDAIRAMPIVERQKVDLKVAQDGTTEWLIEKQAPKNPAPDRYAPGVPPDPDPDITTIKIKGGVAHFYDERGNPFGEPYTFPEATLPSFKKVIQNLKKDSCFNQNALFLKTARLGGYQSTKCGIDYSQYEKGIDLGKGLVELIPKEKLSQSNARVYKQDELISIDYADTTRNLYLGSELFSKADDRLVMRTFFRYSNDPQPVLKRSRQELHDYSEDSQAAIVLITDSFYDNISITNHLTHQTNE